MTDTKLNFEATPEEAAAYDRWVAEEPVRCEHCGGAEDDMNHQEQASGDIDGSTHDFIPPATDTPLVERCVEELPYGVCGEPERAGIHGNESPQNFDGYNHRFAPPAPQPLPVEGQRCDKCGFAASEPVLRVACPLHPGGTFEATPPTPSVESEGEANA